MIDPALRPEIDRMAAQTFALLYDMINRRDYDRLATLVGPEGFREHRGSLLAEGDVVTGEQLAEARRRTLTVMPDVHVEILGMWPLANTTLPTILSHVAISGTLTGRWGMLLGDGTPVVVRALSLTTFNASGTHLVEHVEYQGQDEIALASGCAPVLLTGSGGREDPREVA